MASHRGGGHDSHYLEGESDQLTTQLRSKVKSLKSVSLLFAIMFIKPYTFLLEKGDNVSCTSSHLIWSRKENYNLRKSIREILFKF